MPGANSYLRRTRKHKDDLTAQNINNISGISQNFAHRQFLFNFKRYYISQFNFCRYIVIFLLNDPKFFEYQKVFEPHLLCIDLRLREVITQSTARYSLNLFSGTIFLDLFGNFLCLQSVEVLGIEEVFNYFSSFTKKTLL